MKRFWQTVSVGPERDVLLDGKPVRTPGRAALSLPTDTLADEVAAEWRAIDGEIDPRAMPMTGMANAAIDRVAPDPAAFAEGLSRYGESDLLYYRADSPEPLIERQRAAWDPVLDWARGRYDVHFETTAGIVHVAQPPATLARLREAVAAKSPFALAGLSPIVTTTGSLLLALGIDENAIDAGDAWQAAHVVERWQAELWGEDPLAAEAEANARAQFDASVRFLAALR